MPIYKLNGREIRFEGHAEDRMKERGVSRAQVNRVVQRPTDSQPSSDNRWRLERQILEKGKVKRLVVIIEENHEFVRVVSTWWDAR